MINFNDRLTAVLLENNNEVFIRTLHNNPGDYVTMLVYADWLEENGRDDIANYWRQKAYLVQNPLDTNVHGEFADLAGGLGLDNVAIQHTIISDIYLGQQNSIDELFNWLLLCGYDRNSACLAMIDKYPDLMSVRRFYHRTLNSSGNTNPYPQHRNNMWSWLVVFDMDIGEPFTYYGEDDPSVLNNADNALSNLLSAFGDNIFDDIIENNGVIQIGNCTINSERHRYMRDGIYLRFNYRSKEEAFDVIS